MIYMYTGRSVSLSDWMIIKISGNETMEYLNGIVTLDLENLTEDEAYRSAFLTPSAKIRSIFWVIKSAGSVLLYTSSTFKENLVADLLKYKLSMDVKLEDVTTDLASLYLIESSKRIPGLSSSEFGFEFVHAEELTGTEELSYLQFVNLLVERGILPPDVGEGHNPYELGLADVITLEKGCFLGQEPISRMFHRGNPRKYVYSMNYEGAISNIQKDGEEVGEVLVTSGTTGLGYVKRQVQDFSKLIADGLSIEVIERVGHYPKNERV